MISQTGIELCPTAFCYLKGASLKRFRCLQWLSLVGKSPEGQRRCHLKTHASPPETLLWMRQHVESSPTYQFQYPDTVVKYFDERVTINTLFELFRNKHPDLIIVLFVFITITKTNLIWNLAYLMLISAKNAML